VRRKLLLLNLALLAAAALAGWRLRVAWQAAQERERALATRAVKPLPAPVFAPLPAAEPVEAVGYADIAQKMLFSKDRNPVVVVETPAPPPPKPMPPLPVLFGVMNIDGPTAILAEKAGAPHHEVRPGEPIGPFKLVAVDTQQIVLEWDGKRIERKIEEVVRRPEANEEQQPQGRVGTNVVPPAAPTPPPAPARQGEPGVDIGKGVRACQPGDTAPAGSVYQGMRKVVSDSPFGQVCRWEPVAR
jgi:hypothetical protein